MYMICYIVFYKPKIFYISMSSSSGKGNLRRAAIPVSCANSAKFIDTYLAHLKT